MRKNLLVLLLMGVTVVASLFYFFKIVSAASLSLTGKAKIANTGAYLDFSGYSSNVVIDSTTGIFSGYGFMEDLGWVAFGTIDNDQGPVTINISTGVVTGKAKVISTGAYLDFTGYSSNVIATIPQGVFSGNVFSEDVGWIDFGDTGVATSDSFDNIAPSGGSLTYTNGYQTVGWTAITVSDGTDTGSGLNTSTRTLERKSATITDNICGSYGSFSAVSFTGTYPNFIDSTLSSGNCYQYQYKISDNASNVATYTSSNILMVDTTGPTAPGTPSTTTPTSSTSQTWTFTASSDSVSGLASYSWRTTGTSIASGTTVTNSVDTTLAEGSYNFFVKAVDNLGNISSEVSSTLLVDTSKPTTTDNVDALWHNSTVTITLSCNDGSGSGCASTYYTTNGDTPTTSSTQGSSVVISSPGTYTLKYFSVDQVGNTELVKTATNTIKIETILPSGGSIAYTEGYQNTGIVDLTVNDGTDSDSGINTSSRTILRKSASVIGGVCDAYSSFSPIVPTGTYPNFTNATVLTGNCYIYEYQISDNAGNTTTHTSSNIVVIDTVAPSNPGTPSTTTPTSSTSQTWNFDPSVDMVSGVARYLWRTTGTSIASGSSLTNSVNTSLTNGIYNFFVKTIDNASNETGESNAILMVDTVAPSTTNDVDSAWHNTTVTVALSCTDTAGTGCATTYYTINGDVPTTGSTTGNSIELINSGIYPIKYFSVDLLGNTESVKTATNSVRIERIAPATGSITYVDGYHNTNNISLTIADGTDTDSGLNTSSRIIERKSTTLLGGICGSFGSFAAISPTGTYPDLVDSTISTGNCYQYQYKISDNATNQATYTNSNVVKVDTGAPTEPGTPFTTTPTNSTSQTWTFTAATDAVSGIASYLWRTTGTAITSGTSAVSSVVTSLTQGIYNFFVRGVDNAGNESTESSGSVTVDTTAPVTTDNADSAWHNTTVTVTLSCTDTAGTGCATTYYTINGDIPTTGSSDGTSISLSVPGTYTIKYFSVDVAGNSESIKTATNTVKIETLAPVNGSISYASEYQTTTSVALTVADGDDIVSGLNTSSRVTQRRSATLSGGICGSFGSFSIINPTGTYPNLVDSTVSTGNCYQYEYQISDNATNQASYTSSNIVKIDTGTPTGGSISYINGYQTATSVALTVDDGVDTASDLNTTSRVTQRKSAILSAGTCGSFSSFAPITPTGTYPNLIDSTVANGNCYQYEYQISDYATNQATYISSSVIKIDTGAPSGGSISYADGYYTTASVALTITDGTDVTSGLNISSRITERKSATLSGGTCGSFSSFAPITPTGTYPDLVDSTVVGGNCYQYQYLISNNATTQATYTNSNVVKIDTSVPTAPGTPSTTTPTSSTTQSWIFTPATDAVSGIASYLWRTTGTAITSGTSAVSSVVTSLTQGIYNFFVRGVDTAGNQGSESSSSVTVDTTAPVTTDHISPTWSDSTVVVTLICTDTAGSGCATTYYTTDKYDTPTTGSPTGTTISLSVPGTYTIKYFSVDLAGNTELVKHATNTVKIETSAPTGGNISYTSGYQTTTSVALTVDDGTDTDSGINTSSRVTQRKSATLSAGTCGSFGSFAPITPTGTYPNLVDSTVLNSNCYQYEYQVFDNAHNQATYTSANIVKIDTGAPTGGDISYTSGYQTTASVALTVDDGTDAISGVDTSSRITKRKSTTLSAGTCGSYGSFATITPTGTYPNLTDSTVASGNCYQYEYLVSDTEGNQATYTSSSVVKIDTSSPVTTDNTDSSWHNTSVTITLSCTDTAGSGCATTYYTTNGDVPTTDSSSGTTISLASTGTYTIKYFSVDLAGNTELVKTATNTVKIDTGAPTTPGTPSTTTPTKSTSQTWTFTAATDAVSGIANYLWRTTGTAITSGTSAVNSIATSLTQGIYNFFVRGVDNAGNQGSESTSTLTVDTSGPTISNIVINTTASTTIATISYDTNEIGTSQIEYGLDTTYGTAAIDPDALTPSTAHAASFSPLKPCTTYHYRATSVDQLGNTGLSVDNTFITSGCTASAPVVSDVAENATTVAGGSLSLLDSESKGIALTIPPLYAVADANFQAHQLDKVTVLAQTSVPTSYTSVGNYIYELEALTATDTLISTFDIPLTISIAYGSSDVSSIEEPTLTIWSWDGATWTQLSDCLVDTVAQTVTCSTSHFSVFALFGIAKVVVPSTNTSSSSSSQPSVAGPSSCEKSKPTSVTDLFQINVNKTTAQLFFTSVSDADNYFFSFATTPKGEEHGTSAYLAREGVQNYTINYLKPNTTYYFKVRANNGCMGGDWSQILKVKTLSRETTKPAIYYKGKNILTSVVNPIITGIQKVFIPSKTKSTTPSATATPTNVNTFNQTPVPTVAPTQTINSPEPVVVNQVKTKHCFLWWCW